MERLFFLTVALTVFCVAALVALVLASRTSRAAARRLEEVMHRTGERQQRTWWHPNVRKALFVFVHWIRVRVGLSEDVALRPRLAKAGYRGNGPVDLFLASRVLTPLAALLLAALIPYNRLFLLVAFPALAFLLPDIALHRLMKARREKIRRSIPDAVDLLVICVDAGLGIDQAVLRVSQELTLSHPEITEELLQINREQRAGKPRNEAWKEMADRIELPEIMAFASMLTQTERFGTPISKALRSFSDGIRQRRRQAAEELAAKTTVKIVFPLVLFIFPSIFIVLLGPAILTVMRSMGGLGN
jgi:tight adherence protein C